MARRRQKGGTEELLDFLRIVHWSVGPVLALVAFVVLRFVLGSSSSAPAKPGVVDMTLTLAPMARTLAPIAAGFILLLWGAAEFVKMSDRRRLDKQTGVESMNDMSWQHFEQLVGEAYRRKGYFAEVTGNDGADGGVDVRLSGRDEKVLVQCKQWRKLPVDVRTVRELLGVVTAERADRGIVVTSGKFTAEAKAFAEQSRRIELLAGQELAELIKGVRREGGRAESGERKAGKAVPQVKAAPVEVDAPTCPRCGAEMVVKTAGSGKYAGLPFWGCSKFPTCKAIVKI